MTPTPPSTNSSTGARSPEEQFRVVRKRNRIPVSCYPCRTRKKCDRNHPCSNCTKREGLDTTSCSYAAPTSRKKSSSTGKPSPDDMQNRIDRLESLVLSLMHSGGNVEVSTTTTKSQSGPQSTARSGSSANPDQETAMAEDDSDSEDNLATSLGLLKVDPDRGKFMYFGQEHYYSLLAGISEVKNYFLSHRKELDRSYEQERSTKPIIACEGPTLLFGAAPASELELRAEMPLKSSVITLCNRYFGSMDNAVCIIHGPSFQDQLQSHWEDPSKTPIMWLGLLYAVLTLAMLSYHKVGDAPPEWKGRTLEMASEFRLRTVQCLIKADYTKPSDYTVETLVLYAFGEYSSRWDADLGVWMLGSLITRTAFRMGYHRDAKWFPTITPFQAEMRRRTWALVRMFDVIFSHQLSLPSMIYEHECDTQLPNNIFDHEIYPGIKELPPSRPSSEATPVSYMIAKAQLCNTLGNIVQATSDIAKHVPYDDILRFDAKLRQIMEDLPPHLKLSSSLEGAKDPVTLIIARFNLELLGQKMFCLLHRKYLPRARQNPRYAHSRRSLIDASMRTLDHLSTLDRESQPGGRMYSVRWYIKSIAIKDFALPAMLIILDLHYDNLAVQSGAAQSGASHDSEASDLYTPGQRDQMIASLEELARIWRTMAETSMEAFKACKVTEIMLHKIKNPVFNDENNSNNSNPDSYDKPRTDSVSTPSTGNLGSNNNLPETPKYSFGAPSMPDFIGTLADNSSMGLDFVGLSPPSTNITMDNMGAMPNEAPQYPIFTDGESIMPNYMNNNFDWGAFENYAQMTNWGPDQGFHIYESGGADQTEEMNRRWWAESQQPPLKRESGF